MALSLDVTFKANLPFKGNDLDWDDDQGLGDDKSNIICSYYQ